MITLNDIDNALGLWAEENTADQEDFFFSLENKPIETGIGTFTAVDMYGGEGQGDALWIVFKVKDQLFHKSGCYSSYDGGYYDGLLEEVEAYERTVTDYRPKKV